VAAGRFPIIFFDNGMTQYILISFRYHFDNCSWQAHQKI